MRTTLIRLAVAAVAVMAFAANTAAETNPPGLLNALEVQQLVRRGDPGDHARLSVHFTNLANRYAAQAKRHMSMAQSFVGNPSRSLGSGMSTHCKRLADLNTQSATVVRELDTYHDKLANGVPATPPAGSAQFQGGTGAPQPTQKELDALAARAGTAAEHHELEEYFLTLARRYTAEAKEHTAMAQTYRGTRIAQVAAHYDRLAALARDSAREANEAAAMHKQLAGIAQ
jgi:hypothetical protein